MKLFVQLAYYRTLASEVKCLCVIERRDLSNERNTFKSKTIFYHKRTRLKPERATRPIPKRRRPLYANSYKADPEKKKASVRATATTQILNLSNLLKGSDIKRTSRRTALLKGSDIKRISRKTALLKGSDIKRTSRRTALLKGRNTRTIQLPLRHLKGIGIGMTPLSAVRLSKRAAERKRYRRGHRTTTTTQRYVMAYCIALALKSYRKMCMQHVYSTHVKDLHKTIHFTCKAHA